MPKKEESFISDIDKKNLALVTFGGGSGIATPMILKLYADPEFPDGLPFVKDFVPWPWSSPSTFISMVAGGISLVASIFIKPARYFLLPFGVTSLATGTMLALVTPPLESGLRQKQRVPAGNMQKQRVPGNQRIPGKQNVSGNIKLVSAGQLKSPGSNFSQNPQQRLIQLQKAEADDKLKEEIQKLEEEQQFRRSGSSQGIPLRT